MSLTRYLAAGSFLALAAASTAGCMDARAGMLGTAACPYLAGSHDLTSASISANARANVKIRAFVTATRDLVNVSVKMEAEAADACRRMGRDLGLTDAQMASQNEEPGGAAQAACGALAGQIDAILKQGVSVRVQATPPQCQANLEAKARCDGSCNVEVDPGEIVAQCEPAKLSGQCQGTCVGQCDGTCNGQCQGECSAKDAQGNCVGRCQGTCQGSCSATCHARCEGQWQAPRCEGHVRPPSADADCNASCNAHANFNASCTPAQVNVQASQNVEQAARLIATLQANLPALLHAEIALGRRLAGDIEVVVEAGSTLPNVVGEAGAQGMACIAAASNASVQASARINVSVQASAKVTGKVGASSG